MPYLFLCLLLLPILHPAHAAELKIATWNLNWLGQRATGLPADVKPRAPEDFDRLRDYALTLDADVIAIEEVENTETAHLVFPSDTWSVHLSRDRVRQRVGIAVRRGIPYDIHPDLTALALDPLAHLRSGVDIALRLPSGPVRVLGMHLKQGCQYLRFGLSPNAVCQTLMTQFEIISQWIAARRDEGVSFLVLGDFNRGLDKRDLFSLKLAAAAPMIRATEGFSSPCWGREPFIDHILIGGPARGWVKQGSMRVLTYKETSPDWKARLSDHCPVSVRLTPPD